MRRGKFIEQYTRFIQRVIALSEKSRREGLLALEDECEDIDDEFFKEGLRLVIDGYDAAIINEILSNRAGHEKDKNMRLLRAVQKRAVLAIQQGYSTHLLLRILNSLALLPAEEQKINELLLAAEEEQREQQLAEMENDNDDDTSDAVDAVIGSSPDGVFRFSDIAALEDLCIQAILREVDSQELAKALQKARSIVKRGIFRNMSKRAAGMLKEEIEYMGSVPEEYAQEAQEKILDIVRRLSDVGEIVIPVVIRETEEE